jgi:hypothetical protein
MNNNYFLGFLFLMVLIINPLFKLIEGNDPSATSTSKTYSCGSGFSLATANNKPKCCPNGKKYISYCPGKYKGSESTKYRCSSTTHKICSAQGTVQAYEPTRK